MSQKKRILLKLTGEILKASRTDLNSAHARTIAQQIKQLQSEYQFGIVIGGGNFFRGSKEGQQLGLTPSVGHQIGMLATMMNGLILKDLFEQEGVSCTLFCAIPASEIGIPVSQQAITEALSKGHCLIFTGGTGNPFFTTDTTSVLRGLQIEADQVWKGTGVDGVYDSDPVKNQHATFLKSVTHHEALLKNMGIMDATAFALARAHGLTIRVFNIFAQDAILSAAKDATFGSTIHNKVEKV